MAVPISDKQAPFNMALKTLESIREWIDKIAEISLGVNNGVVIPPEDMVSFKHRMVKQLIILCTPLLEEEHLQEITEYFENIKLERGRIMKNNKWVNNVIIYSKRADDDLDECVMGIQKALQESGHFMPAAEEEGLF